jgi:hypothetical protein
LAAALITVAAACGVGTGPARAQEPAAPPATVGVEGELAATASYVSPPIRGGVNPFGAGFGGRLGIAYDDWYLGIRVIDYLGGSDVDLSYRALLYGVELGYGIRFPILAGSLLTLRPEVGVGDAAVYYTNPALTADVVTSASGSSASDTLTVNAIYVEPAIAVRWTSSGRFVELHGSTLVLPGISYGGATATTWLCESAQLDLGLRF